MALSKFLRAHEDALSCLVKYEDLGSITYEGRASTVTALSSDAKWQIKRTVVSGTETEFMYANKGESDGVWDDRATYFPAVTPAFANVSALNLDGINDRLDVMNAPGALESLDRTNSFSCFAWVKIDALGGVDRFIAGKANTANRGWSLKIDTTARINVILANAAGNAIEVRCTDPLVINTWYHIGFTYDGTSLAAGVKIYMNGVLQVPVVIRNTLTATIVSGTAVFGVGSLNNGGSSFFDGHMDELAVYGISLSAAQVTALYNTGLVVDISGLSTYPDLIEWWRFGDGPNDNGLVVAGMKNTYYLQMFNGAAYDAGVP